MEPERNSWSEAEKDTRIKALIIMIVLAIAAFKTPDFMSAAQGGKVDIYRMAVLAERWLEETDR